jgi:Ca2+-transporting ATPase
MSESASIDAPQPEPWHALPADRVCSQLRTDPDRGLGEEEARRRLELHGPNRFEAGERMRWRRLLTRQYQDVLIAILAAAAVLSAALGEWLDAGAIVAILLLNGVLGFVQEWRAERAIEALQRMLSPRSSVLRGARARVCSAEEVVPGDVVLLDTGSHVPADLRLLDATDLRVDESSLTGESEPVDKRVARVAADAPLAERASMVWMGTAVTHGRARGVVVATGAVSEFGRIAELTRSVADAETPLQRQLAGLGGRLGALALAVSALVAALGWWVGHPLLDMFVTGVSLAVAVVPEGLPAVVTITLAVGIRAMIRRRALLRRLSAAETLGAASVICTDKTGTLTRNEMTVRRIWLPGGELEVGGTGYQPEGSFATDQGPLVPAEHPDLLALLDSGLRCNHADIERIGELWRARGEPTEAALVVAARKAGLVPPGREAALAEFPFSSSRKRMTSIWREGDRLLAHAKGAPEVLLPRCSHVLREGREHAMGAEEQQAAAAAYERFAREGLRTLAVVRRPLDAGQALDAETVEREFVLLGILGILDPPRPEVLGAVALARSAGIRVLMITGDAAPTALAIARRIQLAADRVISGAELAQMDDEALSGALREDVLFARTSPEHKLRIVNLLQQAGHVAAMTGDGVNDAPALKQADIGVAMGLRGTDVARGAADMVLLDDNFATIVAAVEEGRRQYDNIRKFSCNLLSSNLGEVCAILANLLLGGPLLLLPAQILWVNLVTDGLSSVALGVEPTESGVMQRGPRQRGAPLLSLRRILVLVLMGLYVGAATLWLYQRSLSGPEPRDVETARSVAFTGLTVLEIVNSLNFRGLHAPLARVGMLSNPWLLLAMCGSLALQALAVYAPPLQTLLRVQPLSASDWGWIFASSLPLVLASEAVKHWLWRRGRA